MEIDELASDKENSVALVRELNRLKDLAHLRSMGISLAVDSANLIKDMLSDGKQNLRDVNRSLEIVTKTAVLADEALSKSQSAEVEAAAPQRNVVLIILESPITEERKRAMLIDLADEMGDDGRQLIYQALVDVSDSARASELLQLEA